MTLVAPKNESRIAFVDLFRAFGIILMIMGHIRFGSLFDKWIHAFHMPMFFFVSGWFYKGSEDLSKNIKRKVYSLIFPYIFFELAQWLILSAFVPEYRNAQVFYYVFFENTHKIPIDSGTFGISPVPGAMWFLTALFFADLLYRLMDKALGCNWKLHSAVVAVVVLGMSMPSVCSIRLPWALDASFVGIGFLHIARIVRGSKAKALFELKASYALLLGVLFTMLILICPSINMRTGRYGWYVSFWVNALGAITVGWNLSRKTWELLSRGNRFGIVLRWLSGIGKNSIIYLCMNQIVILTVLKLLNMLGETGVLTKVPVLACTMLILFGVEKLFCETRMRALLGKG